MEDYDTKNHISQIWGFIETMSETITKLEERIRCLENARKR